MNRILTVNFNCLLAQAEDGFWFKAPSSTFAGEVDSLFFFIYYISVFFFVLIIGLMAYFVVKYRKRPGREVAEHSPSHNTLLELSWTILPSFLLLVMFVRGFMGYVDLRTVPTEGYEIKVTAKKWSWDFRHPTGFVETNELVLPYNDRPIILTMSSSDVIHSLFVPSFRAKMDVVPGRYSKMWFQPTAPGEYQLFCTEYCGQKHSDMLAKITVLPPGEFEKELDKRSSFWKELPPAEAGKYFYEKRGCIQCHTIDGTMKPNGGPSFKGIFGKQHQFTDGTSAVVDENYIRESILYPQAKIRTGFKPIMPTFQGALKDEQIDVLIEFIKSLK